MDASQAQSRAELALAQAGRDAADFARGIVGDVVVPLTPGERIRAARRLRLHALSVLDRAVVLEALSGATWAELADALSLPEGETIRRYESTVAMWRSGQGQGDLTAVLSGDIVIGLMDDPDPASTAEGIDAWYARHADPWEQDAPRLGARFT